MENLEIYNLLYETPQNATKEIKAGRLKGFSDINPMHRIKKLTETFGPCGFGWRYSITSKEIHEGAKGEKIATVDINLYIKWGGEWSEAIPGTGGSAFIANERNGPYTSDECFKMALTDALSVACKALGMCGDIYWQEGHSKYNNTPEDPEPQQFPQNVPQWPQQPQPVAQQPAIHSQPQRAPQQPQQPPKLPTAREYLLGLLKQRNIDVEQYKKANNLSKQTPETEVVRMIQELEQIPPAPEHVA